eukprot:389998_1
MADSYSYSAFPCTDINRKIEMSDDVHGKIAGFIACNLDKTCLWKNNACEPIIRGAYASPPAVAVSGKNDEFNDYLSGNGSIVPFVLFVGIIVLLLIINISICYWCTCKNRNNKAKYEKE